MDSWENIETFTISHRLIKLPKIELKETFNLD